MPALAEARRRPGGLRRRRVSAGVLAATARVCLGMGAGTVPAAALPAAGPTAAASSKAAVPRGLESFYGQEVEWYDCVAAAGVGKSAEKTGFQCAKVTVPLDYSQPDGQTTEIVVKKRLAAGSMRQGTLLMNPGGLGASGVDNVGAMATTIFAGVQSAYDIIGFDPCGIGSSTAITCSTDAEAKVMEGVPSADAAGAPIAFEKRATVMSERFKQLEADCASRTKPTKLLDHVDTVSVARDLDIPRALSGDQKLNCAGFSYGTYLGATCAELFPANTGRLVLDGALDPSLSCSERKQGQARGFERVLRNYVAWCQSGQSCPLTGDTGAGVQQIGDVFTSANQSPVPSSDPNHPVTDEETKRTVGFMLYFPESSWSAVSEAPGQVINQHDASASRAMTDEIAAQSQVNTGVNIGINCLDYRVEGNMAIWTTWSKELERIVPRFATVTEAGDLGCQAWGHTGTQLSKALHAKGTAPILVIGTTSDPATPYGWVEALTDQLDSGQFLTWEGSGHAAYTNSGYGPCVTQTVDTHLLTGTMPKKGLTYHGKQ